MLKKLQNQPKGMIYTYLFIVLALFALIVLYCARNNALLSRSDLNTDAYNFGTPSAALETKPDGMVIRQEILVNGDLKDLSVLMATHGRKNTGNVTISLKDKETLIASKTVSQKLIRDNTYSKLNLPELYKPGKPTLLTLEIATEGSGESDSVSAFVTDSGTSYTDGGLMVNGTAYNGDLCFSYTLVQRRYPLTAGFIAYSAALILIVSATYWLFWGKKLYALGKRIFVSIKASPLKWLLGAGLLAAAVVLGLLTEYLYARMTNAAPNSLGVTQNTARSAFFIATWMLAAVFFLLRNQVKTKPEKLFVCIMLILGCLFIYLIPAGNFISWDEPSHYYWSLSQSYPGNVYMTSLDTSLWQDPPLPVTWNLAGIKDITPGLNELYDAGYAGNIENAGADRFITMIGHWPAGLGMALARALGLSFQWIFLFGKLGNLIAYTAIIYFAIRKQPSGKMLIAAIACMPTPFLLATVYSYDFWVTAWVMLAYATYFSELAQPDKKLTMMSAFVMLGSMLLACLPKQPYAPLLLPFLFLSKSKFAGRKQQTAYILSILTVALVIAVSFIAVRMGTVGDGDFRGGDTVSVSGQIQYILSNPLEYIKTLFGFMGYYLSYTTTAEVFSLFAYLGFGKSAAYAACVLLLIAVTDKADCDLNTCKRSTRLLTFSGCLITVLLLITSLYIAFTPVGLGTVNGCQPRYLIPLVFPALFLIGSPKMVNHMSRRLYYYMGYGCVSFILLQTIWDLAVIHFF